MRVRVRVTCYLPPHPHPNPNPNPNSNPKLREWLCGAGGRAFIDEQRSILQGLEARDAHAREMAWLVRVVQLQLREKAPQVLRKDVGADELTPLLEQVVVATQPQHGWQV